MKQITVEKRIKSCIENRKTLWTAQIVLLGGLAALFINMDSIQKLILFMFGCFLEVLLLTNIRNANIMLKKLYKILEKIK